MTQAVSVHSLALIVLGNVLFSIGTAPGIAIAADLVVSAAPQERSGAASALSETASEFGGALGIALLGSLTTFLYRFALHGIMPTGIPIGSKQVALRGIGAASSLPASLGGGALWPAAQSAYTSAVGAGFLTSAGIVLLLSVTAFVMFRSLRMHR